MVSLQIIQIFQPSFVSDLATQILVVLVLSLFLFESINIDVDHIKDSYTKGSIPHVASYIKLFNLKL